jgi:hypothetical protein
MFATTIPAAAYPKLFNEMLLHNWIFTITIFSAVRNFLKKCYLNAIAYPQPIAEVQILKKLRNSRCEPSKFEFRNSPPDPD